MIDRSLRTERKAKEVKNGLKVARRSPPQGGPGGQNRPTTGPAAEDRADEWTEIRAANQGDRENTRDRNSHRASHHREDRGRELGNSQGQPTREIQVSKWIKKFHLNKPDTKT